MAVTEAATLPDWDYSIAIGHMRPLNFLKLQRIITLKIFKLLNIKAVSATQRTRNIPHLSYSIMIAKELSKCLK